MIGYCEEGFDLEGKRVFIDMKPTNPTKVFKITRSDDVIYNASGLGYLLSFIADKTEFNPEKDNQELKICDYINISSSDTPLPSYSSSSDKTAVLINATISGNKNLKIGFPRVYSVKFSDDNENEIDWRNINFRWNIVSDFNDKFTWKDNGNSIELLVDDEFLIDEKFKIQIKINNELVSEKIITILEAV